MKLDLCHYLNPCFRKLMVLVLVVSAITHGRSQDSSINTDLLALEQNSVFLLEEGIIDVRNHFNVEIVYEPELVRGKFVEPQDIKRHKSAEEVMNIWLKDLNLRFEPLKKGSYVIVKAKHKNKPLVPAKIKKITNKESEPVQYASITLQGTENLSPIYSEVSAQQNVIKGKVTDQNTGEGIPGVTIIVKGVNIGSITDLNGQYSINVGNEAETLVFSYVGYKSVEIQIGDQTTINVPLEEDILALSEVVVTALGFKKDKDKIGYSSSNVEGNTITNSAEGNVINSLAGKASGVRITRTAGVPGAGSHIQIRGASSVTGLQPLIVLDGVPIDNSGNGGSNTGVDQQSRLNDINPEDIERIDVLKGSAAAALWGTSARNGVLMITTKSGQKGKMKVSFRSSYSFDQILNKHPLQSSYGQGSDGEYDFGNRRSWGDKIADRAGGADIVDQDGEYFLSKSGRIYYPITEKRSKQVFQEDNFNQIFGDGHFWDNSLSVSGGSENSTFYLSLSDFSQQGIIKNNSDYRRSTVRINTSHKLNDIMEVSTASTYSLIKSNRIRRGNSSSGLYIGLLRMAPDFSITDFEGDYYDANGIPTSNRQRAYRNPLGRNSNPGFNNPLWVINNQPNINRVNRFINMVKLSIKPTTWYEGILRVGLDTYLEENDRLFKVGSAGGTFSTGLYENQKESEQLLNTDIMNIFTPKLFPDVLSTRILVGYNYRQERDYFLSGQIEGFIDPSLDLMDFVNGTRENYDLDDSETLRRKMAAYYSIDLGYNDFLFASFTGRLVGSSTFGKKSNKTFFFPSASLAWQFSKHMQIGWFDFGKLRASYGEVGSEPSLYRTENEFSGPTYSDPLGGGSLATSRYGNGGFVPSSRVGNPFLVPQRKKEVEFGTDLRMFGNRLRTGVTYYYNKTNTAFIDIGIANSAGYDEIYENAAVIVNRGIEVDLTYYLISIRDFKWSVGLLWDKNQNEVLDLAGNQSVDLGGLSGVSARVIENEPHGVLWGSKWDRNEGNTLKLDSYGFPVQSAEEGIIGNPNPNWRGSLLSNISFKGFNLGIVIETMQGADIAAGTFGVLQDYGKTPESANESVSNTDLFTSEGQLIPANTPFRGNIKDFGAGPVALTESWYKGRGGYFNGPAEQFIQNGSWTRLQQITLGYTIRSEKFQKATKLQELNISFTGRNLFLKTDFEGNDPNTNLTGVDDARGIDYFNNPGTKSYIFTLKLTY